MLWASTISQTRTTQFPQMQSANLPSNRMFEHTDTVHSRFNSSEVAEAWDALFSTIDVYVHAYGTPYKTLMSKHFRIKSKRLSFP